MLNKGFGNLLEEDVKKAVPFLIGPLPGGCGLFETNHTPYPARVTLDIDMEYTAACIYCLDLSSL